MLKLWCMSEPRHTVGDGQRTIAERSAVAGGARRALSIRVPRPPRSGELAFAAIENQRNSDQIQVNRAKSSLSISCQFVILTSPRGISGSILRFRARQPLRHARCAFAENAPLSTCILHFSAKVKPGHSRSHL